MRQIIYLVISSALTAALFTPFGTGPRFGTLLLYPLSPLMIEDDANHHAEPVLPFEGELWIGYDSLGIPHIQCDNDREAAFGVGYVHARDRLFQLEMMRRSVLGLLTEVAGIKALQLDRFWRKFRFESQCRSTMNTLAASDPETYALFEAYAHGVNAYIQHMSYKELPLEFRLLDFKPMKFEPWHCLLLSKSMAYSLSYIEDDLEFSHIKGRIPDELVEFYYPWISPDAFPVYPDISLNDSILQSVHKKKADIYSVGNAFHGARFFNDTNSVTGSNNWAVSPRKSKSGNPLLCNDTHLGLRLPSTWYEIMITTAKGKRRGLSITGSPFIISGFNENLAWGMTNATWDLTDFYHLDINEKGDAYLLDGKGTPLEPYTETFKVKGGDDVQITFHQSYFGPVDTLYGEVVATGWVGMLPTNDALAFALLAEAGSVEDGMKALQHFLIPAQNFVLADKSGRIGMVTAGLAPKRTTRDRGIIHAKKSSDRVDYFPTNDLLNELDPERGWVASANQNQVGGEAGALFNYRYAPTARGRRIAELLQTTQLVDRDYLMRMQTDVVDLDWRLLRDKLLANCPDRWKKYLENWDGNCHRDSVAPMLFIAWKENLCELFFNHLNPKLAMYPQKELVVNLLSNHDSLPMPDGVLVSEELIRSAIDSTIVRLNRQFRGDFYHSNYGDYHTMWIRHITGIEALGLAPFPASGSGTTVNVAGGFPTTHGPSMRTVIEMTPDGPQAWMMITGGQSGKLNSLHYADQIPYFQRGTYHKAVLGEGPFRKENYVSTLHFKSR